jgi:hypothetical protein
MIEPHRFLANKAMDKDHWLRIREVGITASDIAAKKVVRGGAPFDNKYMEFGRTEELPIAVWIKEMSGIMPNEWVICATEDRWAMATPDGLSLDHSLVSEIKTTKNPWETIEDAPEKYKLQMQWQMYVTGATRCFFAWMKTEEDPDGNLYSGWLEPRHAWYERDETMILELRKIAKDLLGSLPNNKQ